MIKTVIFDLGRVLVPFDFRRSYERFAARCEYTAAEIPERIRATNLVVQLETGQISPEQFVDGVHEALGIANGTFEEFRDTFNHIFLPETLIPEAMVEALRRRYRIVLLSNTNAIHYPMIEATYPILRHFDAKVLSYKVGAMKPSPKIYEEAIRQAQCEPGECFFTDDIPEYVAGAIAQGIDAVQFVNSEQISSELRARGVEW